MPENLHITHNFQGFLKNHCLTEKVYVSLKTVYDQIDFTFNSPKGLEIYIGKF